MLPKAPAAAASLDVSRPALEAWCALGEPAPDRVERLREASRSKPALHRLTFADRPAVYAKQSPTSDLALERMVYRELLPQVGPLAPRCFGSCRDADGATWLFVEDVGDRRLPDASPGARLLAARWLARLHASAAELAAARRLPDIGPARYLGALTGARAGVRRNLGNRALSAADQAILAGLLAELDRLESRWPAIVGACQGLPSTMVHGDFRPKNVRVQGLDANATLYALDWEMAGWGVPAADLAAAFEPGMTVGFDPDVYLEGVRATWPAIDRRALLALSIVGRIFQALAGAEWASASLIFESERHLLRPVGQMRVYRGQLAQAFEAGREHLGW